MIDGELVACDAEGKPDFYTLMRRRTSGLCVWCFDLARARRQRSPSLAVRGAQGSSCEALLATLRMITPAGSR